MGRRRSASPVSALNAAETSVVESVSTIINKNGPKESMTLNSSNNSNIARKTLTPETVAAIAMTSAEAFATCENNIGNNAFVGFTDGNCPIFEVAGTRFMMGFDKAQNGLFSVNVSARKGGRIVKGTGKNNEVLDMHLISGFMNLLSGIHAGFFGYRDLGLLGKLSLREMRIQGEVVDALHIRNTADPFRVNAKGEVEQYIFGMEQIVSDFQVGFGTYRDGKFTVTRVSNVVAEKGNKDEDKQISHDRRTVWQSIANDHMISGNGMDIHIPFKTITYEDGNVRTNPESVNAWLSSYAYGFGLPAGSQELVDYITSKVNGKIVRQALGAAYAATRTLHAAGKEVQLVASVKVSKPATATEPAKAVKTDSNSLIGKTVKFFKGTVPVGGPRLCTIEVVNTAASNGYTLRVIG